MKKNVKQLWRELMLTHLLTWISLEENAAFRAQGFVLLDILLDEQYA